MKFPHLAFADKLCHVLLVVRNPRMEFETDAVVLLKDSVYDKIYDSSQRAVYDDHQKFAEFSRSYRIPPSLSWLHAIFSD